MTEYRLRTPVGEEAVARLRAGDIIFVSGTVLTARDEAHAELLRHGGPGGMDLRGLALFHCGPVMKREGGEWRILAAGPTTSFRMESLEPAFLDRFPVKIVIGKGGMGPATLEALRRNNAVYVSFTGGAGALAAKGLGAVRGVFYLEELGMPEAVWIFEADGLGPLVVAMDTHGNSLYADVDAASSENLARVLREKGL